MVYRNVNTRFWSDPKVRSLDKQSRYLFLYLITNECTHLSGIYYIPFPTIHFETGLAEKEIRASLNQLSGLNVVHFDPENHLIWVVNMLKYAKKGEKTISAVENQLHSLHRSELIAKFLDYYKGLKIAYRYDVDNLSISDPSGSGSGEGIGSGSGEGSGISTCPHQDIISAYHEILPELPQIRSWTPDNQSRLRARWREKREHQCIEWWRAFFEKEIRGSDFLMGRKTDFQANLDWIIGPRNFNKIINGQYRNNKSTGSSKTDRNLRVAQLAIERMEGKNHGTD